MKYALIIGNSEYNDPKLAKLIAPGKDAEDFAKVLRDKNIGAFDDVKVLFNETEPVIREAIDEFFDLKKPNDLLVMYFSGHGVRDEFGSLFLAVKNTNSLRLRATAVKSDFIREVMDQSRSKRQVLILDCCNSGAFPHGTKAVIGASIGISTAFQGYGRIILTASDSTEFAWEGDQIIGETDNSLFTHFLVEGLKGEADLDGDGRITVDDLYDYTYEQVKNSTSKQTPSKFSSNQQGEIILREYTEEQKEQLRIRQLQEKQRQEQEEFERIINIQKEKESVERRKEELYAAKESAKIEAFQAEQELEQRKAKIELTKLEIARKKLEQISFEKPKSLVFTKWYIPIFVLFLISGIAIWAASRNSTVQPFSDGGTTTEDTFTSSDGELNITLKDLDFSIATTPVVLENTPIPPVSSEINFQNASQITQLARWGKGVINQVIYSPDGGNIIVATSIGIYILDGKTLNETRFIDTGNNNIIGVIFSEDGKNLIALSYQGSILKFNIQDGSFIEGTKGEFRYIRAFSFAPDGKTLAIAGSGYGGYGLSIFTQDIENGKVVSELKKDSGTSYQIYNLKYSPDGKLLLSYTGNGIEFWDATGFLLRTYPLNNNYRSDLIFSPNGETFAHVNPADSTIEIINTQDVSIIKEFEGHSVYASALAYSPNGQDLFYTIGEGIIRVRDIERGILKQTLQSNDNEIASIVFSQSGENFITTSYDGAITLWNTESGTAIKSINGFWGSFGDFAISNNDKYLLGLSYTSHLWDIQTGNIVQTIKELDSSYASVIFLPTQQDFFIEFSNINIWGLRDNQIFMKQETNIYSYDLIEISQNEQFLATIQENNIEIWNLNEVYNSTGYPYPTSIFTLSGHTDYLTSLKFSPNNELLVSTSQDGTAKLWNASDGSLLFSLNDHVGWVTDADFSPNGNILATCSDDGLIILWNVSDGTAIRTIESPSGESPRHILFSPNGQVIALGTYDGNIFILETVTGEILKEITSHSNTITEILFNSDGKLLISSSEDGTIRLWGVQ